jgi:hypothetical protein
MNFLKQLWLSVRSNPAFVAFEGGASGALLSSLDDALRTGQMDFSSGGLRKMAIVAIAGGVTAVRLLYRPGPGATPTK